LRNWKFKAGGTRKFKNFLKEWLKIQFVVCVLHKPKLILTNLFWDPVNANIIKDEILALREEGATIIFSTHRMESVEECVTIALIHKSNDRR
jgi:ABC-2 type transport system ATP-binding protein